MIIGERARRVLRRDPPILGANEERTGGSNKSGGAEARRQRVQRGVVTCVHDFATTSANCASSDQGWAATQRRHSKSGMSAVLRVARIRPGSERPMLESLRSSPARPILGERIVEGAIRRPSPVHVGPRCSVIRAGGPTRRDLDTTIAADRTHVDFARAACRGCATGPPLPELACRFDHALQERSASG